MPCLALQRAVSIRSRQRKKCANATGLPAAFVAWSKRGIGCPLGLHERSQSKPFFTSKPLKMTSKTSDA
jgi:hypothetical protein